MEQPWILKTVHIDTTKTVITSTNQLVLGNKPFTEAQGLQWLKDLRQMASLLMKYYKDLSNTYNEKGIEYITRESLAVYKKILVDSVWDKLFQTDRSQMLDPIQRQRILFKYFNKLSALRQTENVISDMAKAYGLVQDEILLYEEYTESLPSAILKRCITIIRDVHSRKDIKPLDTLLELTSVLKGMYFTVYTLLNLIVDLHVNMTTSGNVFVIDICDVLVRITRKVGLNIKTWKITEAGLINDDGLPHDASDTNASGIAEIAYTKLNRNLSFGEIFEMVYIISDTFRSAVMRLEMIPMEEYSTLQYKKKLMRTLYQMVQDKYMIPYICAQNYARRIVSVIKESPLASKLEEPLKEISFYLVESIPPCCSKSFDYHPFVASRVIGFYQYREEPNVGNEDFLCGYSTFDTYKAVKRESAQRGVFIEDTYLEIHRDLLVTYLCNTIYILTHTSYNANGSHSPITVYRLVKGEGVTNFKLAAVFYVDRVVISNKLNAQFAKFLAGYKVYPGLAYFDSMNGDTVVRLKYASDSKSIDESIYGQVKKIGTNELVSNLQLCIDFLVDLLETDKVQDLYVGTTVFIENKQFSMQHHLPYKYLRQKGGLRNYLQVRETEDLAKVIGVVNKVYSAPSFFVPNVEFDTGDARLYTYSVERVLSPYIDKNMVNCITNVWFTKKIFDYFENLALGNNMETLQFAGTTPVHKYYRTMPNNFGRLIYNFMDKTKSEMLEYLKPILDSRGKFKRFDAPTHKPIHTPPTFIKGREI